jgi:Lsr2
MLGLAGEDELAGNSDNVDPCLSKGEAMAKATVEVLIDDLDGSEGVETVRLGWNGEWRELDLSRKNLASLSRAVDRYWNASRPVSRNGQSSSRRLSKPVRSSRRAKAKRDPKVIRAWAVNNGIAVPTRGRIPGRRGTSVQRRQRALVTVARVHGRPEARSRRQVAYGCGREFVSTTPDTGVRVCTTGRTESRRQTGQTRAVAAALRSPPHDTMPRCRGDGDGRLQADTCGSV